MRTLSAAVFTGVLILGASACHKPKPTAPPPPQPPPVKSEAPRTPEVPGGAARIATFAIEPTSIERGQAATLRWSVANATDISINQNVGAVQANGQRQVFPAATTSYTLTARGTGGNDTRTVTITVTSTPAPPVAAPAVTRRSGKDIFDEEVRRGNLLDALFDYDKSDLSADAQSAMTKSATALRQIFQQDPSFKVVVEGHCDERGSAEYNLGLGDRRATSARDFLVQLGVPAGNLSTISYGKERPVCTDETEACYQRNRRAHLASAQ